MKTLKKIFRQLLIHFALFNISKTFFFLYSDTKRNHHQPQKDQLKKETAKIDRREKQALRKTQEEQLLVPKQLRVAEEKSNKSEEEDSRQMKEVGNRFSSSLVKIDGKPEGRDLRNLDDGFSGLGCESEQEDDDETSLMTVTKPKNKIRISMRKKKSTNSEDAKESLDFALKRWVSQRSKKYSMLRKYKPLGKPLSDDGNEPKSALTHFKSRLSFRKKGKESKRKLNKSHSFGYLRENAFTRKGESNEKAEVLNKTQYRFSNVEEDAKDSPPEALESADGLGVSAQVEDYFLATQKRLYTEALEVALKCLRKNPGQSCKGTEELLKLMNRFYSLESTWFFRTQATFLNEDRELVRWLQQNQFDEIRRFAAGYARTIFDEKKTLKLTSIKSNPEKLEPQYYSVSQLLSNHQIDRQLALQTSRVSLDPAGGSQLKRDN